MEPGELLVKVSVMYVWFAIFFAQPHKEVSSDLSGFLLIEKSKKERFLSPAYPLIALGAAVVIDLSVNMLLTALRKTVLDRLYTKLLTRVRSLRRPRSAERCWPSLCS